MSRQGGVAFIVALILLIGAAPEAAKADIVTSNTGGTGTSTFFPGQSVLTPSGGPWHSIMFNFFSNVPATTPTAAGTLFLLSEEYLGTPADLSSSTPGFLSQSQSISGGMYVFDPSVTVQPSTYYFFYANASFLTSGGNMVQGGYVYYTFSATDNFTKSATSANYRLSGTVVPEPASVILTGVGMLMGLVCARRSVTLRRTVETKAC